MLSKVLIFTGQWEVMKGYTGAAHSQGLLIWGSSYKLKKYGKFTTECLLMKTEICCEGKVKTAESFTRHLIYREVLIGADFSLEKCDA